MKLRTVPCASAPDFAVWSMLLLALAAGCSGSSTRRSALATAGAGAVATSTAADGGGTSAAADGGETSAATDGGQRSAAAGGGGAARGAGPDIDAGDLSGRAGSNAAGAAAENGAAGTAGAGTHADAAAADGGGSSVSAIAIATQLGGAICDSLSACLGQQKLSALFSRESCTTREISGLAENDLADLDDSIQKGRVTIHPELLASCYADTRALGCEVQTVRLPASCQAAIEGHGAIGARCSIGSDCSGEAFCPTGACPRACTARAADGGDCTRDEECLTGLLCNAGTCRAPAAIDGACAGKSGGVCAFGASCVGSTDTQAGSCKKNSDVQVGTLGASCSPGGTLCQEGLSCAFDGAAAFSCQAAAAANGACQLALPTECPVDQYCNAPDVMTLGQCAALPSAGSACVLSDECAPGDLCVDENGQNVCRRLADLGEACTRDGLCRSGSCVSGQCAAPAVCP